MASSTALQFPSGPSLVEKERAKDEEGESVENSLVLQKLFISALNDNSESSWREILDILDSLSSGKLTEISSRPEIEHYIRRTLSITPTPTGTDIRTQASTKEEVIKKLVEYCDPCLTPEAIHVNTVSANHEIHFEGTTERKIKRQRSLSYNVPRDPVYVYDKERIPVTFRARKLTTDDILFSCDKVKHETLLMELSRRPILPPNSRPKTTEGFSTYNDKPSPVFLRPLYPSDFPPIVPSRRRGPVKLVEPMEKVKHILCAQAGGKEMNNECHLRLQSAEDMIQAFATSSLPTTQQEVYMEFKDTVPWDPYQLQVIDKPRLHSLHFVATVFGILLVYPDGECEHRSFAEWHRDKYIFRAIRRIKFFREYLPRKSLRFWHQNASRAKYNRIRSSTYFSGACFHIPFLRLLQQINSLSKDMLSLRGNNISSSSRCTREEFGVYVRTNNKQLLKYFDKYFRYCLRVIGETVGNSHKYVEGLVAEKRHKPFVSELPISIQRRQHKQLEDDIENGYHRCNQLKQLIKLVKEIVSGSVISLVEDHVKQWLSVVMSDREGSTGTSRGDTEASRGAIGTSRGTIEKEEDEGRDHGLPQCLWQIQLQINEQGILSYDTDYSQLKSMLLNPLTNSIIALFTAYEAAIKHAVHEEQGTPSLSIMSGAHVSLSQFKKEEEGEEEGNEESLLSNCLLNESLVNDLETNEVLSSATECLTELFEAIENELKEFCNKSNWLIQLNEYISTWEGKREGGEGFRTIKPEDIKVALTSGFQWLDKLGSLPLHFVTQSSHSLVCVRTETLACSLRPRLHAIMDWVQTHCLRSIHSQSLRITQITTQHIEILSSKRMDLEGFAHFSQQLSKIKKERERESHDLQFVMSLMSTLITSGVSISDNELLKQVHEMNKVWEECEELVFYMLEFVSTQTPIKAQKLKDSMEACENEILCVVSELKCPPFTDPLSDILSTISQLEQVYNIVMGSHSRYEELAKWRNAITGEATDATEMKRGMAYLKGRMEIWRNLRIFYTTEREWLTKPFKKLNVHDIGEKLKKWLSTIDSLSQILSVDDPVLMTLSDKINEYNNLLPLLKKLSSSSVKHTHWYTLLAAVEVQYNSSTPYTLQDLLLYKLLSPDNRPLLNEVCQSAEREASLKNSVETLQKKWENRKFVLDKENYDKYSFAFPLSSPSPDILTEKRENLRVTKFALSSPSMDSTAGSVSGPSITRLVDTREVLQELEQDMTLVQVYCGSPHCVGGLKGQLEYWGSALKQLMELVELLESCQNKWWSLLYLFGDIPTEEHSAYGLNHVHSASDQWSNVLKHIREQDGSVLTLFESAKMKGQKGYRDLHGDTLRGVLGTILQSLDAVSVSVQSLLLKEASEFPRLLTLPPSHLLPLITHRGNPLLLLPSLKQIFPSIANITVIDLKVSPDSTQVLRESGHQIVSVLDSNSTPLTLCVPLPVGKRRTVKWLSAFERALRYSLSCHVTGCCLNFPKQLMGLHATTSDDDQCIDTSDLSWLSESVPQAALLTVQSKWTPIITSAFDNTQMIDSARSQFERIINHLIQLLNLTSSYPLTYSQTITTLRSLIISAKHKLDLINGITRGSSSQSFSHHILYQLLESPIHYHPSPSRLSSVPSSLTNSRNSMTPLAATGRLHPLPEPLIASTKSLVSSRFSAGTQSHTKPSALSSAKSLMPTVPSIGTGCRVQCGPEVSFNYGFEYYGSDISIVLPPSIEKSVVSMMRSLVTADGCNGLLLSEGHSNGSNLDSARDVAKVLGRPYYTLTCISTTSTSVLLTSLSSSLQSGSILILQSFNALPVPAQIVVSQWLKEVYEKMRKALLSVPDPVFPSVTNKLQYTGGAGGGPYAISSTTSLGSHHDYKSSSTSHVGGGNRMDWYSSAQHGVNLLGPKAEIELTGEGRGTLVANGYFSCIAVVNEASDNEREDKEEEEKQNYGTITEEVVASFRCVQSECLDLVPVTECLLLSCGYSSAASIAIQLVDCLNELKVNGMIKISMPLLKLLCTTYCHQQLLSSSQYSESHNKNKNSIEDIEKGCVWRALIKALHFSESDREAGLQIIHTKLGICIEEETQREMERGYRKTLIRAIEKELEERHLQMKPEIIEKIMELDNALESQRCVVIYGPSSSGKSTLYQLLSQAHNHLLSNNETLNDEGRRGEKGGTKKMIYVTHINPEAYTVTELFGGYTETATGSESTDESSWSTGILARLFQQAEDSNNRTVELKDRERGGGGRKGASLSITHWIVFNGFNWNHIHWLESLLNHPHKLKLSNGDTLCLPDNCQILIETLSLPPVLSPSLFAHCSIVHCNSLLTCQDLTLTWLQNGSVKHDLSVSGMDTLSFLMDSILPQMLEFAASHGNTLTQHIQKQTDLTLHLIQSFLSLLSAVLDRHSPKKDDSIPYSSSRVSSSFFGGTNLSKMDSVSSMTSIGSSGPQRTRTHSISDQAFPEIPNQSSVLSFTGVDDSVLILDEIDKLSTESDYENITQQYLMTTAFVFSLIWSFGGYIDLRHYNEFSKTVRDIVSSLPMANEIIPVDGLVFDYFLDQKSQQFLPWSERKRDSGASKSNTPNDNYVPIPELERLVYISELYLGYGCHVLFIGEEGSGKTSFLKKFIQPRMSATLVPISSSLTPMSLQSSLLSRISQLRKRQTSSKKASNQRSMFILDDLHLASLFPYLPTSKKDEDKSNWSNSLSSDLHAPLINLVSHLAEHKTLHDDKRGYTHSLSSLRLVGTCTTDGVKDLSLSLLRQMRPVPFISISNEGLHLILQQRIMTLVKRLPVESVEKAKVLVNALATASLAIHDNMKKRFNSVSLPSHPHIHFSLHHASALVDGLLLMEPTTDKSAISLMNKLRRRGGIHLTGMELVSIPGARRSTKKSSKHGSGGVRSSKSSSRLLTSKGQQPKSLPPLTESSESTGDSESQSKPGVTRQQTHPGKMSGRLSGRGSALQKKSSSVSLKDQEESEADKMTGILRALFRVWCHEASRVFTDHLTQSKDKIWFSKLLESVLKYCFCGAVMGETGEGGERGVGGGRRARPGRPSKVSQVPSSALLATSLSLVIQASDLKNIGIDFTVLQELLPKESQHQFLTFDQIAMRGEDLSSFIFCRLSHRDLHETSGAKELSSYNEVGDGELRILLADTISNSEGELSHIFINKDIIEHVTRLSRALILPGGNVLYLGPRGVGRKTTVKLSAAIVNAKVYSINQWSHTEEKEEEVNVDIKEKKTKEIFGLLIIREACKTAALDHKRAVLLVDGSLLPWYHELWDILLEIMRTGLSPSLFTSSELILMSFKAQQGKMLNVRRTAETAYQSFAQAVFPFLHIVITWDTPGINNTNNEIFRPITYYSEFYDENELGATDFFIGEEQRRSLFNTLTKTTSYMDHYLPWSKNSFSEVALQFWQSPSVTDSSVFPTNTSKLEALSFLAAHIHLSSCNMLQKVSPTFTGWMFTVRDYKHCLEMGYKLALDWKLEKEKSISQYHAALSKLYDLERQFSSLKWKLDEELSPRLLQAKDDAQIHMEKITAAKQHYMAADKRCKDAEETIKRETEETGIFKKQLDDKFNEVSPLHYSALKTLSSVERSVVMEIMGYRIPPGPLMPVFEALCLLFDRPATWLDCQQLMLSQHFFESLKFFDKDGVPKSKLRKLEKLLVDQEKMSIEVLADASQAIVPLVLWITALVDYRKTRNVLQPYKEKLQRAENTLTEAQEVYVDMRQEMLKTKAALEETVESHKVALKKSNTIEGEVKLVEEKIASTKELLGSLSNQRKKWENKLSVTQTQLDSLSSHSLLVSASCTYLGFLPPEEHKSLWENWISYCSGHVSIGSLVVEEKITHDVDIKLQKDFSFHNALATDDEKLVWEREEIFPDILSLEKCLQWKAVSCYSKGYYHQVVFDPLSFFSKYMNGLTAIKNDDIGTVNMPYVSTDSTDSELTVKLLDAAEQGKSIAVHIQSLSTTDSFNSVLNQILSWSDSSTSCIALEGKELSPLPHFQVYFVFSVSPYLSPLHSVVGRLLLTTPTILISSLLLSQDGLSSLFQSHILQCMRRELCIQRRASMADISLHQKQVTESQEIVLSQVLELDWSEESNKFTNTLKSFIKESEGQEQSALSHIKESRQSLDDIAQRTSPYKSLSSHAALSFITCQRLSQKLPQINIGLKDFLDMLQSLCGEREGMRFHSSHTSLAAYLCHLESSLTSLIHERLSPHLFTHQLIYFPLLLAILKEASTSSSSGRLLTSYILNPMSFSIQNLLDDIMFTSETRPVSSKKLATEGVINIAHSLEAVEGLKGLMSSIQTDEEQWSDYFKSFSSLLLPTPFSSPNTLSPTHILLLWKALEPNQFDAAIKDYICLTLGPQSKKPHSFSVPSNHVAIILLLNKNMSFNELISVSNERGLPVVTFSALKFVDIDRLRELLLQPVWVFIDHLYYCENWMNIMERINQCLESSQGSCHSNFKCFIPLSLLQLFALKRHGGLSSYHVIALPANDLASSFATSVTERLHDYHSVLSDTKREPQSLSIDELKIILSKIHSLLPPVKSNLIYDSQEDETNTILETILSKAHTSLQSLQSYVNGHQLYTAGIGLTLNALMDNNVPTDWYYPHQHINKGKSLVEFIQLMRHLYYY